MAGNRAGRTVAGCVGALAALCLVAAPADADTRAGTLIENVAAAHWRVAAGEASALSNLDRLLVAERLGVALAAAGAPTTIGNTAVWPVRLTNSGNGEEACSRSNTTPPASTCSPMAAARTSASASASRTSWKRARASSGST